MLAGVKAFLDNKSRMHLIKAPTSTYTWLAVSPQGEKAVEDLLEQAVAADGDDAVKACQLLGRQLLHHLAGVVVALRADHGALDACVRGVPHVASSVHMCRDSQDLPSWHSDAEWTCSMTLALTGCSCSSFSATHLSAA